MVIFHRFLYVYQRVNLQFPMVFLWFSYGFPMVFLWASQCHIPGGDGSSAGSVPPGVGTPSRSQPGMGLGERKARARGHVTWGQPCSMAVHMDIWYIYICVYVCMYVCIYGSYMDHIWIIYGSYMESPFLIINHHKSTLPSGKRLHNYGNSTHFSWDNSLFLWPCSIAFCMFTGGCIYIYIHIHVYMDHIGDPGGTWWLTIGVLIFPSPPKKKKNTHPSLKSSSFWSGSIYGNLPTWNMVTKG